MIMFLFPYAQIPHAVQIVQFFICLLILLLINFTYLKHRYQYWKQQILLHEKEGHMKQIKAIYDEGKRIRGESEPFPMYANLRGYRPIEGIESLSKEWANKAIPLIKDIGLQTAFESPPPEREAIWQDSDYEFHLLCYRIEVLRNYLAETKPEHSISKAP